MPPWLALLHGYHVLEDQPFISDSDEPEPDSVVVERKKIEELELWFFGVSEGQVGDEVTNNVRSHLLDRNPKEVTFFFRKMLGVLLVGFSGVLPALSKT